MLLTDIKSRMDKLNKEANDLQVDHTIESDRKSYKTTYTDGQAVFIVNADIYASGFAGLGEPDTFDLSAIVRVSGNSYCFMFSEEPQTQLASDFEDINVMMKNIFKGSYKLSERKIAKLFSQKILLVAGASGEFQLPRTK